MPPHSLKIAPKNDELLCEIAATDSTSCRRVGWTWSSHSDAGARPSAPAGKTPLIMQKVTETPSSGNAAVHLRPLRLMMIRIKRCVIVSLS